MASFSNIPAWKIPWTEEPGRPQSIWSWRARHNWAHTGHVQESVACSMWDPSRLRAASVVLLECSHICLFAYCLWLLFCCICCLESLQWKSCGPQILKYLLSDPLKKKNLPTPAPENVLQHLSCLGTYKKIITQHIGTNKWNVCKLSQVKVRMGEGTITLLVLEISPSLFASNTYSPVSRAFNSVVSCFPCIINPLPDLLLWFLFSLSNIFWEEITLTI